MVLVAVAGTAELAVQTWLTVKTGKRTYGKGVAQERTRAAEEPTPAIKPTDNEQRILFTRGAGVAREKHEGAADIALKVNKALASTRVPAHIRI